MEVAELVAHLPSMLNNHFKPDSFFLYVWCAIEAFKQTNEVRPKTS